MLEVVFHQAYPMARRAAQVRSANAIEAKFLTYEDRRDLEQEGLLAFWRSLPHFDPTRASIRTFAERVITNHIASVLRAEGASRRVPVCLPIGSSSEHLGGSVELRIDVRRIISHLNDSDGRLAWLLAAYSPTEASRILRKSRSAIYESISRIRIAFLDAGIGSSSTRWRTAKSHNEDQVEGRYIRDFANRVKSPSPITPEATQ